MEFFYSDETEKNLARKAMELLWHKDNFRVNEITYSNDEIRQKLLYEMMPEILDRAVGNYRNADDVRSETPYLASCIFRTLIDYDAYIARLFRQTYRT